MSKPYSFIPLLKTKSHSINKNKTSGRINLQIKVLNAIHISMNEYDMEESGILYKKFFRIKEQYAIPGTSIKGMIRNVSEMISNSCIAVSRKAEKYMPDYKKNTCKNEYCIVCDTFGAMGKKSKIKVSDFIYKENSGENLVLGMPSLRAPKVGKLYIDNNILRGYKIYNHGIESIMKKGTTKCECLMKGSIFNGYIIYEDLDEEELNLICYSLGLTGNFNNKIGYGKSAYYGSIEITTDNSYYIKCAEEYKNKASIDIRNNIDRLEKLYNFKNAKKVSDYEGSSY